MTPFSELRQQAGLSIQDVAQQTGFAERTVYRWEGGENVPRKPVFDLLKSLVEEKRSVRENSFTFIDLFAGIGGLRRGFESIGGKCIFTSEWDRYSQKTYLANFPNDDHAISGDIRQVKSDDIPDHDVLLAGFPCQPFSIAGVSKKNALTRSGASEVSSGNLCARMFLARARLQPFQGAWNENGFLATEDRTKPRPRQHCEGRTGCRTVEAAFNLGMCVARSSKHRAAGNHCANHAMASKRRRGN